MRKSPGTRLALCLGAAALAVAAVCRASGAEAQQPDPNLRPRYGSVTLKAGFTPDPYKKEMTAGGSIKTNLGGVNAFIERNPDLSLHYTGGNFPLIIHVASKGDTTVLVNLPDGSWLANDDGGQGLNPRIRINNPKTGRYDIWVGTYGKKLTPATLHITEIGGGK